MKYKTQYDEHVRHITASGSPDYVKLSLDKDGDPFVVSLHNRYDEIQSHRESVELSTLLQRYAAGDESVLNQNTPLTGDFTDMPSSLREWTDRYRQAFEDFNGLPDGLKSLFNNNPAEFWTTFGSQAFNDTITQYRESISKQGNGGSNGSGNNPTEPDN